VDATNHREFRILVGVNSEVKATRGSTGGSSGNGGTGSVLSLDDRRASESVHEIASTVEGSQVGTSSILATQLFDESLKNFVVLVLLHHGRKATLKFWMH
jgi:hypothetical protein